MRGKTVLLALVAVMTMLCATAVAFAHDGELRIPGTKGSDELAGGDGNNKLYARAGDDMVDGGDPDEVVCGPGEDTVLLGRNDEVVVAVVANDGEEAAEPGDDDCEHVKYPKGEPPKEADDPVDGGCIARFMPHCSDPEVLKPEPDEPVEEPEPDTR